MSDMVVLSGCLGLVRNYLAASGIGAPIPAPPSYMTLGSGTVPVSALDEQMAGFELYRVPLANRLARGPYVTWHGFLDTSDSHPRTAAAPGAVNQGGFVVTTAAVWAGGATLASGSGDMIVAANEPPFGKDVTGTFSADFRVLLSGTVGGGGMIATSGGLQLLAQYLTAPRAEVAPAPPAYVVFGTDAAVGRFQRNVPAWEIHRAPIINRVVAQHRVTWSFLLPTSAANGVTLRSVGIMAGDATAASGTGTLLAVAAFPSPIAKTVSIQVSGNLSITISGAGA